MNDKHGSADSPDAVSPIYPLNVAKPVQSGVSNQETVHPVKALTQSESKTAEEKPISVQTVRKALCMRIKNYPGGIEGVWRAIDPIFKATDKQDPSGIKGIHNRIEIKHDTFRRQVTRLSEPKNNRSTSGKITFSINGSNLLLMNILEKLGIKTIKDLLGESFQETDVNAVNIATNINTEEIMKKIEKLYYDLKIFRNRTPRFPVSRVCRDWEKILTGLQQAVSDQDLEKPESNNDLNAYIFHNFIQSHNPKYSRFALRTYDVIKDYREYFSQDILLHKYCESILTTKSSEYNLKNKYFSLSPLYILYFFIMINNRFLKCIQRREKGGETYLYDDFNIRQNNDLNELVNGQSLDGYIFNLNHDIYKIIKSILSMMSNNNIIISEESYKQYYSIIKETIGLFFNIYSSKTDVRENCLDYIIKQRINNLSDLYDIISLEKTIFFIPNKEDIEKMNEIKNRLDRIESELIEDSKRLSC
jgi:hypothetical protein